MTDDEIKAVRKVRHEISAEHGHDVNRVVEYYRKIEKELRDSGEFRFEASTPPERDERPHTQAKPAG